MKYILMTKKHINCIYSYHMVGQRAANQRQNLEAIKEIAAKQNLKDSDISEQKVIHNVSREK